jgi:hypothetical protein
LQPQKFQRIGTIVGISNQDFALYGMRIGVETALNAIVGPVLPVFRPRFATGTSISIAGIGIKLMAKYFLGFVFALGV